MNIGQKKFLITRKNEYNDSISNCKKTIIYKAMGVGLALLAMFISKEGVLGEGIIMQKIFPIIQLGISIEEFVGLILELAKKFRLEIKVELIDDQLKFYDLANDTKPNQK